MRGDSHARDKQDKDILKFILRNNNVAYIGMIGSIKKVNEVFYAPIGLDIGAETPAGIAVSIITEIIATRYGFKTHNSVVHVEMVV